MRGIKFATYMRMVSSVEPHVNACTRCFYVVVEINIILFGTIHVGSV